MSTTKITLLPVLTAANISANGANTVFVVVDKSSGTATTKQLTLQSLDSFVDNIGPVAFAQANSANVLANTANTNAATANTNAALANTSAAAANTNATNAGTYANAAFAQANTDFTNISTTAADYGKADSVAAFRVEANGRISSANSTAIAIAASAITSGTLGVTRGGSGAGTFTNNGVLLGQGTSAFTTASSSTEGHVLTINASGVPTFAHLQGGTF